MLLSSKVLHTLRTELCLKVVLRHTLSSDLTVPSAAWQELGSDVRSYIFFLEEEGKTLNFVRIKQGAVRHK